MNIYINLFYKKFNILKRFVQNVKTYNLSYTSYNFLKLIFSSSLTISFIFLKTA